MKTGLMVGMRVRGARMTGLRTQLAQSAKSLDLSMRNMGELSLEHEDRGSPRLSTIRKAGLNQYECF